MKKGVKNGKRTGIDMDGHIAYFEELAMRPEDNPSRGLRPWLRASRKLVRRLARRVLDRARQIINRKRGTNE